MTAPRIALVHATPLSIPPIGAAFERLWPGARRMNLLDDSLSVDRAQQGELTPEMVQRFIDLARYAESCGCSGILFTCSAFGPAIEAAGRAVGIPVLKPNEAMFEQALAKAPTGRALKLALLATFAPSIDSMSGELMEMARQRGVQVDLQGAFVPEAMDDLRHGRTADHHRKIAEAAQSLGDCDAVMLAQFSMADARAHVQEVMGCPVLSTPDCAVLSLRERMGA